MVLTGDSSRSCLDGMVGIRQGIDVQTMLGIKLE